MRSRKSFENSCVAGNRHVPSFRERTTSAMRSASVTWRDPRPMSASRDLSRPEEESECDTADNAEDKDCNTDQEEKGYDGHSEVATFLVFCLLALRPYLIRRHFIRRNVLCISHAK